jgi:hypothetical protein
LGTLSQFTLPGILFALTLAFGFWLSHAGRPYKGILFNAHKLIALAGVVLTGMQFYKILLTPQWFEVALLVVLALCVVALFASGAFMSAGKLDYALTLTTHRIALVVLGMGLVWAGFLLVELTR